MDALDPVLAITFESRTADCAWLGPDLELVYNKAYQELIDHPSAFGKPARQVWATNWDYLEPLVKRCLSGTPVYKDNDPLFWRRYGNGRLLEHYHTWRYVPITGKDGSVLGIFNQSIEVTDSVLLERRMGTTRELLEHMSFIRTTEDFFSSIADVFSQNPTDIPFALCYRVRQVDTDGTFVHLDVSLQSSVGVPEGHPSAPDQIPISFFNGNPYPSNVERSFSPAFSIVSIHSSSSHRVCHVSEDTTQWPIAKALQRRQCVIIEECSQLIEGYPIRRWDELPFSAIVVPICSEGSPEIPDAVVILGLNVRRCFDHEYDSWIHSIRSQLSSALVTVKAREAEQKMVEENARMEKAKVAWFRGAAHDLRSPLTLVAGPLADVLDSDLSPNQRTSLTVAQRNLDRLVRLVNALMDFSRVEAGRMEGRFVPTNLSQFITQLAALFKPAVERLGLEYVLDVQPREELVFVDPVLFETVVSNLIGNALKYTETGCITVRVKYTDYAEVSVIDTGVGIPKNELALVTEWFHRASTAIHSGTQGTGLGLALAKELLKLHKGELLVESQTANESGGPHGSIFTARVPLDFKPSPSAHIIPSVESPKTFGKYSQVVANEAMRWVGDSDDFSEACDMSSGTGGSSASNGSGNTTAFGPKFADAFLFDRNDVVLIVEDNADMREYIRQLFTPYCTVVEACNGEQAYSMATQNPPNLILSDVLMSKLSGTELLQKIRSHPDTRIVPMVLISAIAGDESRVEALLNGADDYLAKPFKPKELIARVHLHMQVGKKRAKLEALYAQRETELTALSDYCPIGIFRGDKYGHIVYANAAWRAQSGLLVGDPNDWASYVHPESKAQLLEEWNQWLRGDLKEFRAAWRWSNGIPVRSILVRLDHVKEGFSGLIGCVVDVSHEERRLIEAEERRKEAEESKHQQELLIDLTSHEIRTPVSAILQCSDLVKENLVALKDQLRGAGPKGFVPTPELLADLEQDVEALESIYQCGLVQERIAGDVLSLARIQLDMLSLHDIDVNLRREGRKVSSIFASEAKMKDIDLRLEFGPTIEQSKVLAIKTDPVRLGQVVTNLISNAIRFTSSSAVRKITIQYDVSFVPPADDSCAVPSSGVPDILPAKENTPLWLFVSVTDSGPGMTEQELSVLFQRFAQGNKMIHTKYGGSGLGLFICRKITELLGGRIEVLSQLGHGSVFRFFIKTRAVAPPSAIAALVESSPLKPISATSPSSSLAMSRSSSRSTNVTTPIEGSGTEHVLIVEDNLINQTVLKRQLIKAGLSCNVASNGLEALNIIRETHRQHRRGGPNRKRLFDVVLMDLEMPVMDGITAVQEIRGSEAAGTLGRNMVIALTGNARQGQIDHALASGFDDVVIKPYILVDLLKKIKFMKVRRLELETAKAQEE